MKISLLFLAACCMPIAAFFHPPLSCKTTMSDGSSATSTPTKVPSKPSSIGFDSDTDVKSGSESAPNYDDKYKLCLFNDEFNTRAYVGRCLVSVVGLPESEAFSIMSQAHQNGMAIVGVWHGELAEAYCEQLKSRTLIVDVFPLGKDTD